MKLTEKQRKHLRGLGHELKPLVLIGKAGLTDAVEAQMDEALTAHELVKVRITGMEREVRDETLESLAQRSRSTLAGQIGHTGLLYRRNNDKPRIVLPR
jgi:RNA-binding protein